MTQLLMRDDPEKLNPLQGLGHFVCVDGFGPVSKEERAAGLPGHGEAHRVPWEMLSADKKDGTLTVAFTATLPIVQETFRRTIRMVDGESVVYIDSELESLLGFDRPINWGEHATIGGPFLEQGKTVTEMSARRSMTRSYESEAVDPPDHHNLADYKEFTWPMAPTAAGPPVDMRIAPTITPVMDQTTSLMDPSRRLVFVSAFHPGKQARVRVCLPARRIPVAPDMGFLPGRDPPLLARPGVRRSAFRSSAPGGHRRQLDVRHADLPVAPCQVEDRIELRDVLHPDAPGIHPGR